MAYAAVFVSYSSADRDRVIDIDQRLVSHGIATWIDKNQIPGGATWTTELVRAISHCKVVLLMASASAFASKNVEREIGIAGEAGKIIIPVLLDAGVQIPEAFRFWLVSTHYVEASGTVQDWFPRLAEALHPHLPDKRAPGTDARDDGPHSADRVPAPALVAHLADRAAQERQILIELEMHTASKPQRPLVLVVHGESSQCPDGFVTRLCKHTLPQHLKRLRMSDQLEWHHIQWPTGESELGEDMPQRAGAYRVDINLALGLGPSSTTAVLANSIENRRRPVVFSSLIESNEWSLRELPLVRKVLQYWGDFPDINRSQLVVVCLVIVLSSQRANPLGRWLKLGLRRTTPQDSLQALKAADQRVGVVVLPELADVTQSDLEHWVRQYLKSEDLEEALTRLREYLRSAGIRPGDTLPMSSLLPVLRRMLALPLSA